MRWIAGDFAAAVDARARRGRVAAGSDAEAAGDRDDVRRAGRDRVRRRRRGRAPAGAGAGGLRRAGLVLLPPGDALGGGGARLARGPPGRLRGDPAARGGAAARHAGPALAALRCSTWPRPPQTPATWRPRPRPPRSCTPWRSSWRLPLYRGFAAAGSAWAALAGGDGERAVEAARRAVELLSTTGCRAHLARAHYVLGRSLPADERPEAVAALEQSGGDPRAVRKPLAQATVARGHAPPRQRRPARGRRRAGTGLTDPPRTRGGPARRDRHEREGDRPGRCSSASGRWRATSPASTRSSAWSPSCSSSVGPRSWGSRERNPYRDPYCPEDAASRSPTVAPKVDMQGLAHE